jgi:hypothetical protein
MKATKWYYWEAEVANRGLRTLMECGQYQAESDQAAKDKWTSNILLNSISRIYWLTSDNSEVVIYENERLKNGTTHN